MSAFCIMAMRSFSPTPDSTQCWEKMGQEEWAEPIEDSDHAALVPTATLTLLLNWHR
jgi:hypothetical protein